MRSDGMLDPSIRCPLPWKEKNDLSVKQSLSTSMAEKTCKDKKSLVCIEAGMVPSKICLQGPTWTKGEKIWELDENMTKKESSTEQEEHLDHRVNNNPPAKF